MYFGECLKHLLVQLIQIFFQYFIYLDGLKSGTHLKIAALGLKNRYFLVSVLNLKVILAIFNFLEKDVSNTF